MDRLRNCCRDFGKNKEDDHRVKRLEDLLAGESQKLQAGGGGSVASDEQGGQLNMPIESDYSLLYNSNFNSLRFFLFGIKRLISTLKVVQQVSYR